jgi:peroxin-5
MTSRFGLNMMPQNYRQGFDVPSSVLDIKGKGKGKLKETDFDAAFAQVASSLDTAPAKVEGRTLAAVDPVEELEKDLSQAKLDDVPLVTPEDAIRHVEFKRFVVLSVPTVP